MKYIVLITLQLFVLSCCRLVTKTPESSREKWDQKCSYYPSGDLMSVAVVLNDSIKWTLDFNENGTVNFMSSKSGEAIIETYFNSLDDEVQGIIATSSMKSHSIFQYQNWGPQRELRFFSFVDDSLLGIVKPIPKRFEFFKKDTYMATSPTVIWEANGELMNVYYFNRGYLNEEIDFRKNTVTSYDKSREVIAVDSLYMRGKD